MVSYDFKFFYEGPTASYPIFIKLQACYPLQGEHYISFKVSIFYDIKLINMSENTINRLFYWKKE